MEELKILVVRLIFERTHYQLGMSHFAAEEVNKATGESRLERYTIPTELVLN